MTLIQQLLQCTIEYCYYQQMKLTVIQSPINQITEENILQRYASIQNKGQDHIQIIRNRLATNLKKIEQKQPSSSTQKTSQFKQLKYNILNVNVPKYQKMIDAAENVPLISQNMHFEPKNHIKSNVIRNLNFGAQFSNSKENVQESRNQTLNNYLLEIGEFKKSIKQIRQKFGNKNTPFKKQNYSDKRERHAYEHSRQKFSYTNYKDLSNKKANKRAQDRWRSNDKSYSYIKNRPYIEQFTIDAFNGQNQPS